jgi:hypothetical protein
MSKPSGNQTTTQMPDKDTLSWNNEVRDAARNATFGGYTPYGGQEVAGMHPWSEQAYQQLGGQQGQYGNYMNQGAIQQHYGNQYGQQGQTGMQALAGNQGAVNQMMNPYQSGVIDQVKSQYGDLNAAAQMGIQDQATKAGAFGGSRHGVASGVASGEIAKGLGQQIAGLQHQGYNDAMGRAAGLANLGLSGQQQALGALGYQSDLLGQQNRLTGQQYGMGMDRRALGQQQLDVNRRNFNEQRDWDVRNFDILRGASGLPGGMTQSTPMYSNPAAGFLGGAATGAGIGSAIPGLGTAAGAGIGGVLGLF